MAFKRLYSSQAFEWLRSIRCDFKHVGQPCRVSCHLPSGYESYVKIFHAIYEDQEIAEIGKGWEGFSKISSSDLIRTSGAANGSLSDSERPRRISWKGLCEYFDIPFDSSVSVDQFTSLFPDGRWPYALFGPIEGTLDTESCFALISVLREFSRNEKIYFEYDSYAWPPDWNPEKEWGDMFYVGRLEDLLEGQTDGSLNFTPTLWWPESHDWVVYSDWDLSYTLIAGSSELSAEIRENETLEALQIGRQELL